MKTFQLLPLLALLLFQRIEAQHRVLTVPGRYPTIQSAINAAANGDRVLVSPGHYYENINFRGKRITVSSLYALNHNPHFIESTVIDGSRPAHPDTASVALFISGEDSTSVLQGFTITGGRGTRWADEHSVQNLVYVEGGGILIARSSPTIRFNKIVHNQAIRATGKPAEILSAGGGGIRCGDGAPVIANNVIAHNTALYGAGIVMNFPTGGTIRNNVIADNNAVASPVAPTFGGGGIWILRARPLTVENNTIVGNGATGAGPAVWAGKGGGIIARFDSTTIRNNIIWGNTQANGGPVALSETAASVTYNDCDELLAGAGNISAPPGFANAYYYFLTPGSPCVDAGNPSPAFHDPARMGASSLWARWPSLGTVKNDMGAYGGPGRTSLPPTARFEPKPPADSLVNLFPNPVTHYATLSYQLSAEEKVTIRIYNKDGHPVRSLADKVQNAGSHRVEWDRKDDAGKPVVSGNYILVLQTGTKVVRKHVQVQE